VAGATAPHEHRRVEADSDLLITQRKVSEGCAARAGRRSPAS
jgi:hypothetical protein